ncbi:MAG: hypothetical protein B7X36_15155 [Thiomonas sp. 14-64-326]|nr:MAG: hypothetical protein B7X36_15155 [Thiomonas sp. 14-64-326]
MQPSSVQSFLRFPLTHLLASGGHVRVLRALLTHGGAQSAAQLASDCAMTARGVRNTLDALVAQGAVKVLGPASSRLFVPALNQPLVSALAQLFEAERQHWRQGLGERLGVPISPVVLTPSELAKLSPSDPWWAEVSRDAKVLKGVSPAKEAARCAKAAQPA